LWRLAITTGLVLPATALALAPGTPQNALFIPPSATPAATFAGAVGSAGQLGASVALSANGQVALVGAPAAAGGGAAYLYVASDGTWPSAPTATFAGPSGAPGEYGTSVALSANGQVALVGAPGSGPGASDDGAAYLYVELGGSWPSTPTVTFPGPVGAGTRLGSSVALSANGQVAMVGAPVAGYGSASTPRPVARGPRPRRRRSQGRRARMVAASSAPRWRCQPMGK
jgi:hypothetical protein